MAKKKSSIQTGTTELASRLRAAFGADKVFNINQMEDLEVSEWIPTGSTVLDASIRKGGWGGYPRGRTITIEAEESVGKTFMAYAGAVSAQKAGDIVVYFDTEFTPDRKFLLEQGFSSDDPDGFWYIPTQLMEDIDKYTDFFLKDCAKYGRKVFFIWDSMANTGYEGEANLPVGSKGKSRGIKAQMIAEYFRKYTVKFGLLGCTLLVTNQLRDLIDGSVGKYTPAEMRQYASGGRGGRYNTSLLFRATRRKAKDALVWDSNGFAVGTEVKIEIYKSRFGTYKRALTFKLLWGAGTDARIWDEDSWAEAIRNSEYFSSEMVEEPEELEILPNGKKMGKLGKATKVAKKEKKKKKPKGYAITMADGEVISVAESDWLEQLETNIPLRERVKEIIGFELIDKFAQRIGKARDFYALQDEEISDNLEYTDDEGEDPEIT